MNKIDFSQTGGFPLTQDVLAFLQSAYGDPLSAIARLLGNYTILSGCVVSAGVVSDGWVVVNGEILPFQGGPVQSHFHIAESTTTISYANGATHPAIIERYCALGTGANPIPFNNLVQLATYDLNQNILVQVLSLVSSLQQAYDAWVASHQFQSVGYPQFLGLLEIDGITTLSAVSGWLPAAYAARKNLLWWRVVGDCMEMSGLFDVLGVSTTTSTTTHARIEIPDPNLKIAPDWNGMAVGRISSGGTTQPLYISVFTSDRHLEMNWDTPVSTTADIELYLPNIILRVV